jgi:hypothetical protein
VGDVIPLLAAHRYGFALHLFRPGQPFQPIDVRGDPDLPVFPAR